MGVVAVEAHEDEVGAGRERLDAAVAEVGQAGGDATPLLDERADPTLHVGDVADGERPGELLGGVEVVRQDDLVELVDHPRRRHGVAEPGRRHAPRLGERAHDDESAFVADPVERRPRRELGVGLVDDHEPGRRREHERRAPRATR